MDMAAKVSITLPTDMVNAAKQRVAAGSHASISEVFRDAMRAWLRQEEEHEERLAALRARVQESLADSRPRIPVDDVFDRLINKYDEMGDNQ